MKHVAKLKSLEELELGGGYQDADGVVHPSRINDAGLVHLTKLPKLRHLNLWGTFSDAGLVHLKNIPSLRTLVLFRMDTITDAGLAHLSGLTELESLYLYDNTQITDKGMVHLKSMRSLKKLNVAATQITDAGLVHLAEIKSLEYLDLPYGIVTEKGVTYTITDKGIAYLGNLNKLKHLAFGGTGKGGPISDTGLSYLTQLHSLEELAISGRDITDVGMTGGHDSVLGRKTENVLRVFRTQMPSPFEIATSDVRMSGVVITVDSNTKFAESIERVQVCEPAGKEIAYDSDDGKPEFLNGF